MALARACLAAVMALPCGWTPAQPALTVVADAHPPFLLPARDGLAGPYAEAFHYLAGKAGLEVALKTAPAKRALLLAAAEKNTCALDVNFDQARRKPSAMWPPSRRWCCRLTPPPAMPRHSAA